MNLKWLYLLPAILAVPITGLSEDLLKLLLIFVIALGAKVAMRNVPGFELCTLLVVIAGRTMGPWAGIYVGVFTILVGDILCGELSFTLWNVPAFALVGGLAGVLPWDLVIVVAVLTLLYDILTNAVMVLFYGGDVIQGALFTAMHVFVNILLAGQFGARIVAFI